MQIADLHCDLLCYLAAEGSRSPYDSQVRCSISQLQKGGVKWQVMPIFTETNKGSADFGIKQAQMFQTLPKHYPEFSKMSLMLAIENGSSFCNETEKLEEGLNRLGVIHHQYGKVLYLGLTWNTENRFGGGASTSVGLKREGEILLEYLHEKKIALDLSHGSDALAYEALSYIDKQRLDIPVVASHSNARKIMNAPRNLPDELIHEIIKRKGVIGFNFVKFFVGESPQGFIKQLEHFLALGAENFLCFGADFFYENDVSLPYRKAAEDLFHQEFGDASTYPSLLKLWADAGFKPVCLEKIANLNFSAFIERNQLYEATSSNSLLSATLL